MTNLHTTTSLTEFTPLSPEQEQSSVGSFFAKVFSFKTSPADDNENTAPPVVNNVSTYKKKNRIPDIGKYITNNKIEKNMEYYINLKYYEKN